MLIIILYVIISVINYVFITTVADMIVMGIYFPKYQLQCKMNNFIITKDNIISFQSGNECAAYSSAYVMRHLGLEADGNEIYNIMTGKLKDGCVYPKGILNLFPKYGLHIKYCRGNLNSLKNEISKGNPVIVMIRTYADKSWLHYVPVVGYDENNIFIAESLKELVNCNEKYYNRTVENSEFKKLWNTCMLKMPLYKNTYMLISNN